MASKLTSDVIKENGQLCPRCIAYYLLPRNNDVLCEPESSVILRKVGLPDYLQRDVCPCCFGALSDEAICSLTERVWAEIESNEYSSLSVYIDWSIPPIFDAFRVVAKTAIQGRRNGPGNMFNLPNIPRLQDTLQLLLTNRLEAKHQFMTIVTAELNASAKLTLTPTVQNEMLYCETVCPTFVAKKQLKRAADGEMVGPSNAGEVSRHNIDKLMGYFKSINDTRNTVQAATLDDAVRTFMKNAATAAAAAAVASSSPPRSSSTAAPLLLPVVQLVEWNIRHTRFPVYLFGRYRKLARDVPQSPWTVGTTMTVGTSDGGDDTGEGTTDNNPVEVVIGSSSSDSNSGGVVVQQRKGRCSVEEVIAAATTAVLNKDWSSNTSSSKRGGGGGGEEEEAVVCRMHACGREDIDVRCLGNGRPFVLEVSGFRSVPSREQLAEMIRSVNARELLNVEGDVELLLFKQCDRSVWSGMQLQAEEKKKGYSCVVWTAAGLTKQALESALKTLMMEHAEDVDEEGKSCLKITQKTPLRVLHRRSLLDRVRYIYDLEAVYLNNHFFLLKLVTSAGAYVKEFVHGDMGRTQPSIATLLGCNSEILQLDVTALFDDYEGGYKNTSKYTLVAPTQDCSNSSTEDSGTGSMAIDNSRSVAALETLSWEHLKCMRGPVYK